MSRPFFLFFIFLFVAIYSNILSSSADDSDLAKALSFLKGASAGVYEQQGPNYVDLKKYRAALRQNASSFDVVQFLKNNYLQIKDKNAIAGLGLEYIAYLSKDQDLQKMVHETILSQLQKGITPETEIRQRENIQSSNARQIIDNVIFRHLDHAEMGQIADSIGAFAASLPIDYELFKNPLESYSDITYINNRYPVARAIIVAIKGKEYFSNLEETFNRKKIEQIKESMQSFIPIPNASEEENNLADMRFHEGGSHEITNYINSLFHLNNRDDAKSLLKSNLPTYTSNIRGCNECQSFLVVAAASDDSELQKMAQNIIKKRILEDDPAFTSKASDFTNNYSHRFFEQREELRETMHMSDREVFDILPLSINLSTISGRASYFVEMFNETYARITPQSMKDKFARTAVALLKDNISDYELIRERIEYLWYEKFAGREQFAKMIIEAFKGEEYLKNIDVIRERKKIEDAINFLEQLDNETITGRKYYNEMNNLRLLLLRDRPDEKLFAKLEKIYPTIHDKLTNYEDIFSIYLIVAKNDAHLAAVKKLINDRFAGQDKKYLERFKAGNPFPTAEARFQNIFYQLIERTPRDKAYQPQAEYLSLITDLLSSIDVDINVIRSFLESNIYLNGNPNDLIAQGIMKKRLGEKEFELLLQKKQKEKIIRERDQKYGGYLAKLEASLSASRSGNTNRSIHDFVRLSTDLAKIVGLTSVDDFISDLVREKLEEASLLPDYWRYRALWPAAENSSNASIKQFARDLISRRIEGVDGKFNNGIGKKLTTKKDRLAFYFDEILNSVLVNDETKKNYKLAKELILSWDYDYALLEDKVESMARNLDGIGPEQKDIIHSFIEKHKGKEYLNTILTSATQSNKKFIFINGGYSPTSNSENQEDELLTFHYNFFNGQSILLNGGGANSQFYKEDTNLAAQRDSDGFAMISPTKVKIPTLEATTANVKNTFTNLANNQYAKKITLIYTDHGGPGGVALWDGKNMDAVDFRNEHDKIPESTMIQSMYMACYVGAEVADINRRPPHSTKLLSKFLKYHYRKNRCALAKTSHNELGISITTNLNWKENSWTYFLRQHPTPTLNDFKNFFFDNNVFSTPVLTSDYFLEDITTTMCQEHKNATNDIPSSKFDDRIACPTKYPSLLESIDELTKNIWRKIVDEYCTTSELKLVDSVNKEASDFINFYYNEFLSMIRIWQRELIQKQFPAVYEEYLAHQKEIDELTLKYANDITGKMSSEDKDRLEYLKYHYPTAYTRMLQTDQIFTKFPDFFNTKLKEVMTSGQKFIWIKKGDKLGAEQVHTSLPKGQEEKKRDYIPVSVEKTSQIVGGSTEGRNLAASAYRNWLNQLTNNQQRKLDAMKTLQIKRRTLVEQLLNDPQFAELKDIYDSIIQCENTPIN